MAACGSNTVLLEIKWAEVTQHSVPNVQFTFVSFIKLGFVTCLY